MPTWLATWMERHQHPACRVLHALGIPLTVVAAVLLAIQVVWGPRGWWCLAAGLLLIGYFLQWLGHCLEGNEMGEIIVLKKCLGLSYVAVSPRHARDKGSRS